MSECVNKTEALSSAPASVTVVTAQHYGEHPLLAPARHLMRSDPSRRRAWEEEKVLRDGREDRARPPVGEGLPAPPQHLGRADTVQR